ncbi:MAG: hypothetical protein EA357_10965 [Micavibrio sp.]|nr:MAG: hypothetical protein EA357_10965 [Micavibrio sp.]
MKAVAIILSFVFLGTVLFFFIVPDVSRNISSEIRVLATGDKGGSQGSVGRPSASSPPKTLEEHYIIPPIDPSDYHYPFTPNPEGIKKKGLTRQPGAKTFYLYTPENPESGRLPAVILLHGGNRDGLAMADRWRALADRHGVILVAPDGKDGEWDYAAEKSSFERLFSVMFSNPAIDRDRIYLFGHSAGGMAALPFAADFSERIAAVSVHAAMLVSPPYQEAVRNAKRKIPLCLMIGSEDPVVSPEKAREAAQFFADAGHAASYIELDGHNHWYYTLADWINEYAWQCMIHKAPDIFTED